MNKPETIYKYFPFSANSLRNLQAQSIYFGSPLNFNDPYDCALTVGIKDPSEEEIKEIQDSFSSRDDVPHNVKEEFGDTDLNELREIITRSGVTTLNKYADMFLNIRGVSCFAEKNDDLLMWSNYGGRYKGFCLAFDTSYQPFNKIRRVKYTDKIPKISAVSALINNEREQWMDLFCTKSISWEYEEEWRCFHEKAGTLFTYEDKALKAVYLGPDIDINSLNIICLILAGQNPDVELWRGKRSSEKFEVIFDRFTYISYVESIKAGLIT